jgi:hypothetical protein
MLRPWMTSMCPAIAPEQDARQIARENPVLVVEHMYFDPN